MKSRPIVEWLAQQDQQIVLLHGQRLEEGWRFKSAYPNPPNATVIGPIADWTTEQVFEFLKREGVELPAHYAEVADSPDCWICPAHWSMETAPAFSRYLRREYPGFAETLLPTVRKIHEHVERATARMRAAVS